RPDKTVRRHPAAVSGSTGNYAKGKYHFMKYFNHNHLFKL
ncbi:hypothetical protein HMPREF0208_03955, partial [Citrobacter koseri]